MPVLSRRGERDNRMVYHSKPSDDLDIAVYVSRDQSQSLEGSRSRHSFSSASVCLKSSKGNGSARSEKRKQFKKMSARLSSLTKATVASNGHKRDKFNSQTNLDCLHLKENSAERSLFNPAMTITEVDRATGTFETLDRDLGFDQTGSFADKEKFYFLLG